MLKYHTNNQFLIYTYSYSIIVIILFIVVFNYQDSIGQVESVHRLLHLNEQK